VGAVITGIPRDFYGPSLTAAPFAGLPANYFGTILIDAPQRFITFDNATAVTARGNREHYKTMPIEEIAALPVRDLVRKDAIMFCWVTSPMLPTMIEVIKGWGFTYKTLGFVWAKVTRDNRPFMGMGYWTRAGAEVCILATCGNPKRVSRDVRQLIMEPKREHSRKPDRLHADIERLVGAAGGPFLELFARNVRPDWTQWGDQLGLFDRGVAKSYDPAAPHTDSLPIVNSANQFLMPLRRGNDDPERAE
jgi:N6-adenosine-specific RNA methylase IME4